MTPRDRGRIAFVVAFVVLLVDGAASIWLGQVSGRGGLVGFGLLLVAAAAALSLVYRRWKAALDEVDAARRALRVEVEALRQAVHHARAGGGRPD
jgi:hypothetical protein